MTKHERSWKTAGLAMAIAVASFLPSPASVFAKGSESPAELALLKRVCHQLLQPATRAVAERSLQSHAEALLNAYVRSSAQLSPRERVCFVRHAEKLGPSRARHLARHVWLTEDEPAVRDAAARLAAEVGEPGIIRELLASPSSRERLLAVRGLRHIAGNVAPLVKRLRTDAQPEVRSAAARVLADSHDPIAWNALLLSAATDPNERVRKAAARALQRCLVRGDTSALRSVTRALVHQRRLSDEIAPLLPDLFVDLDWDQLLELATDARPAVEAAALRAIGARFHRLDAWQRNAATKRILEALRPEQAPILQRQAIRLAAQLRLVEAAPVLVERLRARNLPFLMETVHALQRISGQRFGASYHLWKRWLERKQAEENRA